MGFKRGQVWVETVIYTLIGLAVIGLVLAGAMPKINQKKDELAIGQSIEILTEMDNIINEVQRAPGNRLSISINIGKGYFVIDAEKDSLSWTIDSSFPYSEIGLWTPVGGLDVLTTGEEKPYSVEIKSEYSFDIRYNGEAVGQKRLDVAPTPYRIMIENSGKEDGKIVINVYEV